MLWNSFSFYYCTSWQFLAKVTGEEGMTGYMLRSALSTKLQNLRQKGITKHNVWDRFVFSKAKNAMGMKNVRLMISGGAPLPTQTMEVRMQFLKSFFKLFFAWIVDDLITEQITVQSRRVEETVHMFYFAMYTCKFDSFIHFTCTYSNSDTNNYSNFHCWISFFECYWVRVVRAMKGTVWQKPLVPHVWRHRMILL